MSIVGGPYRYDLFFSYSWADVAEDEGDLRDWSRMVIDRITRLLRQRFNSRTEKLEVYLDREATQSGSDLDASIRAAIETAALTVLMVSRFSDSSYCQKEIDWLISGVGYDNLQRRASILRIQQVEPQHWMPEAYRTPEPRNPAFIDVCDNLGPLNLNEFLNGAPTPDLAKKIRDAALELIIKLEDLRKQAREREEFRKSQQPPTRPVLFFEGEPSDRPEWAVRKASLVGAPSIVLPGGPIPATAEKARYDLCDAVVLYRKRPDDNINERIGKAYQGLRTIHTATLKQIPWALLDELQEPPEAVEAYDVPRVTTSGDWVKNLNEALVV
jgi:hypothetical protein